MTQMANAIAAAGLSIPLNKRIWMYMKDFPRKSSSDIAKALNAQTSSVQSACFDLKQRDMVVTTTEHRRVNGGGRKNSAKMRDIEVLLYEVNPRMRGEYELWPVKFKKKKAEKPAEKKEPLRVKGIDMESLDVLKPGVVLPAPPPTKPEFSPAAVTDGLTLAQCKELYKYLHDMFTNFGT